MSEQIETRLCLDCGMDSINERFHDQSYCINTLRDKLAKAEAQRDKLREALIAWANWWNGPGRFNYSHPVIPPITKTDEALADIEKE